jgi:hypothetical protein
MTTITEASMRSPVDPGTAVVNASNADLRAELDYRNADTGEATQRRYQKYAVRFVLDAAPGEDASAANLARVLGGCVRPPRPFEYPAIRMHVDTYRMAQMSGADAVRDTLRDRAESYASDARKFADMPKLGQTSDVLTGEDCKRFAAMYRTIADELRKVAASL